MSKDEEEPSPEYVHECSSRLASLTEFFKINNIDPYDAVFLSMIFIAKISKPTLSETNIVSMFKRMAKAIYRGKE